MADETTPQARSEPEETQPAKLYKNLRPRRPGDPPLNPSGTNGWKKAQARIAKIMSECEPGQQMSRLDEVILASYRTAIIPGPNGAHDRRLLIEQSAGKAKQQVELANPDGSKLISGVMLVPVPVGGTEGWETAAGDAQEKLQDDVDT